MICDCTSKVRVSVCVCSMAPPWGVSFAKSCERAKMPPGRKSGKGVSMDVMGASVAKGVRQQPSHRYAVAQRLTLSNSIYAGKRPGGLCSVLARLPYEGHGAF